MIAAVVRALIQLRMRKKPRLDDCLLLFACVLLTASTALLYHEASSIYFAEALVLDLAATPGTGAPTVGTLGLESEDLDKIFDQVTLFQRIDWAYAALTWTAIYSVKFAFLSFFRCLVDRLPRVHRFWKIVGVITALAFAFAVCEGFIACPKLGVESRTLQKSTYRSQSDVGSDMCSEQRHESRSSCWGISHRARYYYRHVEYVKSPQACQSVLTIPKFCSSRYLCSGGSK